MSAEFYPAFPAGTNRTALMTIVMTLKTKRGVLMKHTIERTFFLLILVFSSAVNAGTWQLGLVVENGEPPFIGYEQKSQLLPVVNYMGEKFS